MKQHHVLGCFRGIPRLTEVSGTSKIYDIYSTTCISCLKTITNTYIKGNLFHDIASNRLKQINIQKINEDLKKVLE